MSKALFLDRDGVLNEDHGYTYKIEDCKILEGAVKGLQLIAKLEYKIIIITNQSGIARGLYSVDEFHSFMQYLLNILRMQNIPIAGYFFCPHHPEGIIPNYSVKCLCRKPEAGMIYDAKKKFQLDLSQSILVGDKESDIQAGKNAGLLANILITNSTTSLISEATHITPNLIGASKIIATYE